MLRRIARRIAITRKVNDGFQEKLTFGQCMADRVAAFGDSWFFIILFSIVLAVWVLAKTLVLAQADIIDPYPLMFPILILSMLAAVQAPVIMMSQNRQTAKDRLTASLDHDQAMHIARAGR